MLFGILYIEGYFLAGNDYIKDWELLPFHILFGVYFIFSVRRVYKTSLWEAVYKGGLGTLMFFFLISIYKQIILLFAFVMYPVESLGDFMVRWFTIGALLFLIVFNLIKKSWDYIVSNPNSP